MPDRRPLSLARLDDVMPEVDLLLQGYQRAGNWSLGQICGHLAGSIRSSVEGFGFQAPWLARATFGRLFKRIVLGQGRIGEGIKTSPKFLPGPGLDDRAEAEAFRATIAHYLANPVPRASHPYFGRLTPAEWDRFHCIHCAHHLSFALPTRPGLVPPDMVAPRS